MHEQLVQIHWSHCIADLQIENISTFDSDWFRRCNLIDIGQFLPTSQDTEFKIADCAFASRSSASRSDSSASSAVCFLTRPLKIASSLKTDRTCLRLFFACSSACGIFFLACSSAYNYIPTIRTFCSTLSSRSSDRVRFRHYSSCQVLQGVRTRMQTN